MDRDKTEDIIKKYLEAESTLAEESSLFQGNHQSEELGDWFAYVHRNKSKAPAHLKDTIRAAIQKRKRKKRRLTISLMGAAASVLLLAGVFIFNTINERNEYARKEALLNEAKAMFSNEERTESHQNILFENEMVIIYLADNHLKQ